MQWFPRELLNGQKEILAIILCIQKFQDDVFNRKFLLRFNCKNAKENF